MSFPLPGSGEPGATSPPDVAAQRRDALERRRGKPAETRPDIADAAPPPRPVTLGLGTLFLVFLKSGLAFGGGSAITALLMDELVEKRRAMSRSEYVTLWGLGRIVPSGTTTALAVAVGASFQGFLGTLVTLLAVVLPSFTLTVLLTVGYQAVLGSPVFTLVNATLMPAALGIVVATGVKLLQEFFYPCVEVLLVGCAFLAVWHFGVNPPVVLVACSLIGALTIRGRRREAPR